ncbi:nitroreductase family protein [Actinomarinicola tropica]|uniref:Putative NAD(P)H nitroreductase n=1 Tax=Actinomarinicola tropica TaxID=2789776 RepID=A0A5Q2RPJ0_9ACTN|nr:nitroreductase [Actinomarinicola tropica]QGG96356.1 nitroreductase [Actinomarinicola tropica]
MSSDPIQGADERLAELAVFSDLVTRRRTSLLMDRERPVPADLVARLCRLATWAPNHKKTWPWRFAVLTGDARRRLGELTAEQLIDEGVHDEAKLEKALVKYLRAPTIVMVAAAPHPDPELHAENRDAVAAAVQTFLLGATAAGLASFWASGAPLRSSRVREMCGFGDDDRIVALVYLGWPAGDVEVPLRPEPEIAYLDG